MHRNLGHQRAICIGLAYVEQSWEADAIAVMDADGEDDPADLMRLLERCETEGGENVVFAERRRRSEGLVFRTGYSLYRLTHRLLVGPGIRVGNFSVLGRRHLRALVVAPEMWNPFAPSVFAIRLPMVFAPANRVKRLSGRSSMDLVALVMHGLSVLAVYSDRVATRVVAALSAFAALSTALALAVVGIRRLTDQAIPGWASQSTALAVVLVTQSLVSALVLVFLVLNGRRHMGPVPLKDCQLSMDETRLLA